MQVLDKSPYRLNYYYEINYGISDVCALMHSSALPRFRSTLKAFNQKKTQKKEKCKEKRERKGKKLANKYLNMYINIQEIDGKEREKIAYEADKCRNGLCKQRHSNKRVSRNQCACNSYSFTIER